MAAEIKDRLTILVDAYQIVKSELFSHFNGSYQNKREQALFILTKLIIDELLENYGEAK